MTARKKIVVTTAVLFTLAAGGVAVALWSATGSGSGQAQATTAVAAEIAAASGEPDLFPGFTDGDVSFTITNDNPYDIEFTDMTAGTVTSSDEANCPASNVTVAGASGLSLFGTRQQHDRRPVDRRRRHHGPGCPGRLPGRDLRGRTDPDRQPGRLVAIDWTT